MTKKGPYSSIPDGENGTQTLGAAEAIEVIMAGGKERMRAEMKAAGLGPHDWYARGRFQRYVCQRCGVIREDEWEDDNDPAMTAEVCLEACGHDSIVSKGPGKNAYCAECGQRFFPETP